MNWKQKTIKKMKQARTAKEVSDIAYQECLKNCKLKRFRCAGCIIVKEKLNLMWNLK